MAIAPKFVAAAERLSHEPFFSVERPDKDAGPFLNSRVPWDEAGQSTVADLSLDATLLQKIEDWGAGWASHTDDGEVAALDTSWMAKLHEYGRWQVGEASHSRSKAATRVGAYPFPEYRTLRAWAKVRLLQGLASGDAEPAAGDVRQLAWLCFTHENLLAAMNALGILRLESDAYEAFVKAGAQPRGWVPMSSETISDLRKACWTATYLGSPMVAPELNSIALGSSSAISCVALTERAFALATFRSVGERASDDPLLDAQFTAPVRRCNLGMARTFLALGASWTPTPFDTSNLPLVARPGAWFVARFMPGLLAPRARSALVAAYFPSDQLPNAFE
ncbi:MAG: hypothetical protein ACYC8T_20430 [Myxococcaceae bacterium]